MTTTVPEILLQAPVLSPREDDVLHALAAGYTYQQFAEETGVPFESVKSYARNLLRKLGASNAAHAVAAAFCCGLLTPPARKPVPPRQPAPMGTPLERELLALALAVWSGRSYAELRPLAMRALTQARAEGRVRW